MLDSIVAKTTETKISDASSVNRGLVHLVRTGKANATPKTVGALMRGMSVSAAQRLLGAFLEDTASRVADEHRPSVHDRTEVTVVYPPPRYDI